LYVSINWSENEQLYDYSGFNNYFDKPITIGSSYKNWDHLFRPAKITLSNILIKSVGSCYTWNVYVVTWDCQMTAVFTSSGSCTYGWELYENWSVLTWYQSDSVICPDSCVSQVATCISWAWNVVDFETTYNYSTCNYSGFNCSAEEYPLQTCPENWVCSSCTGYTVSENACVQTSPVYKLESCNEHYHVNGNVCEIDSHMVTIVSNNTNSWTVTTWSITVPYGTSINTWGNVVTIGSETSTANPNSQTWQYDFEFVDWTNACGETVTTWCTITANFQSLLRTYTLDLVINTWINIIYYKVNWADNFSNTWVNTTISGIEAWSQIFAYAVAKDGYTTDTSSGSPWSITVTGNNIFSPVATANTNTQYIVYHYVKRVWSGTYQLTETETWHGTTDATLLLSWLYKESQYPCAHYDRWSLTWTEAWPWEIVTQTTIKWDGSTKIYLYYTRNNYTVHLSGDAWVERLEIDGQETTEVARECGSEVPVNVVPKLWYHFVRWDREESEIRWRGENEDDEVPEDVIPKPWYHFVRWDEEERTRREVWEDETWWEW
jgi:hypothetical protein